ncbi:B3 domain-containing protein REM16 [Citrus sinensis]|uniref:B3 domain-containing protein REM16 n=1 Tax=Citrus sinensis TaxID=2711 RepID=A0ACB8KVK5_CITSI|nr:B3 domain-containing protein REM16 [Citrus sinensis]
MTRRTSKRLCYCLWWFGASNIGEGQLLLSATATCMPVSEVELRSDQIGSKASGRGTWGKRATNAGVGKRKFIGTISSAIPEKVARNLRTKLPVTVSLKAPSGFTWVVGITTRDHTLYFSHGWPEFVKDHFLGENDILFFKYNGGSHFDVLMFDGQSQCEKAVSYFVKKCGHTEHSNRRETRRKIRETSVEGIPNSSHCDVDITPPEKRSDDDINKIPVGQPIVTPASSKRIRRDDTSNEFVRSRRNSYFVKKRKHKDHGSVSQTKRRIGESCVEGIPNSSDCDVDVTLPEKASNDEINKIPVGEPIVTLDSSKRIWRVDSSNELAHTRRSSRSKTLSTNFAELLKTKTGDEQTIINGNVALSPPFTSNRRPVTQDEKNNALLMAQAVSTTDSFTVVMRPTHVYKRFYMAIPASWMSKYLTLENQDVILRLNEKTWITRFQFCKPRCSGGLSGGWKNFAVDNHLDEFDVCVFSPDNPGTKPMVLNVSIFRVVNAVVPLTQVAPASLQL